MDTEDKTVVGHLVTAEADESKAVVSNMEFEPEKDEKAKTPVGRMILHRFLSNAVLRAFPALFILTAVLVYVGIAVLFFSGAKYSSVNTARSLLGDFTGGAENVYFTKSEVLENEPPFSADIPQASESSESYVSPESPIPVPEASDDIVKASPPSSEASPDYGFPIQKLDMSSSKKDSLGLTNETPYTPELAELAARGSVIPPLSQLAEKYGADSPVVLIIHTHTTEGYAETCSKDFRSSERSEGVLSVGDEVMRVLEENGIPVIHCTEVFDYPDFNMAYYNASLAIRKYISEYESLSYIIDIHRDSVVSGTEYIAPTAEIDGKNAAQLMLVVGTDHGGSGHKGWEDNLSLAARIQKSISGDHPALMRDINLRSASFNEQYTKGSLLLEVGSCASSVSEAVLSARIFARYLSSEIIGTVK